MKYEDNSYLRQPKIKLLTHKKFTTIDGYSTKN